MDVQTGAELSSHESTFPDRFVIEEGMDEVEIYKGDIIEFEDAGEEGYEYKEGFYFTNRASVTFENYRWELKNFISNNSSVLYEMNDDHEDFINVFSHCKVIGNIRENPGLLNLDKESEEDKEALAKQLQSNLDKFVGELVNGTTITEMKNTINETLGSELKQKENN